MISKEEVRRYVFFVKIYESTLNLEYYPLSKI